MTTPITRIAGVRVSASQTGSAPVFIYTQGPSGWNLHMGLPPTEDEASARIAAMEYRDLMVLEDSSLVDVQYGFHGTMITTRCERVFQADAANPVTRRTQGR